MRRLVGSALALYASLAAAKGTFPAMAIQAASDRIAIETFTASPYPYHGQVPGEPPEPGKPFLEGPEGARYHISPRGGTLMEATTYSDRRSLLAIPTRFDPDAAGAAIILFFHGNLATLKDVEGRQGVPRQFFQSGMNAVLVAPQLAVDALDSSPGHFYEAGFFDKYLDEAEAHLAAQSRGRFEQAQLEKLPVVIVAYSGGYVATAFSLSYARPGSRIRGVILLDALFGESAKIEDWIARTQPATFFLSAYSKASSAQNAALETALAARGVGVLTTPPRHLAPGSVVFLAAPSAVHNDFVTRAWTVDPLRAILGCLQVTDDAPTRASCDAPRRGAAK